MPVKSNRIGCVTFSWSSLRERFLDELIVDLDADKAVVEFTDRAERDLPALLAHQSHAGGVVGDFRVGARPGRTCTHAAFFQLLHQPPHRRVRRSRRKTLVDERFRDGPESRRTRCCYILFVLVILGDEHAFPSEHCGDVQ